MPLPIVWSMKMNGNRLIAEEGKVLCRMSDGWIAGPEIYLGYTYYLGGIKQENHYWNSRNTMGKWIFQRNLQRKYLRNILE